jgi:hypothetical protein
MAGVAILKNGQIDINKQARVDPVRPNRQADRHSCQSQSQFIKGIQSGHGYHSAAPTVIQATNGNYRIDASGQTDLRRIYR